ncbi:MAG TPA: IS630 family transposase [Candidatus Saccharimonadales bacterium]|nr:IS630 family transposase [Candidatus Saccharimonadales bacterium]
MGQPVEITRRDHTASELRAIAARTSDSGQARRLLAIAMVLEGVSRAEAAERCGMQRQTLRDWVHRYNAIGTEGLKSGHGPGRPASLTADQMAELKELVVAGPDPEKHGVVRWRCVDLRGEVARRFAVEVAERTIGKWLHRLKLTRLQPRPFHPKKDEAAQTAFKKNFAGLVKSALLSSAAAVGRPIEIWFQDEARVGQKGGHAYIWAPIGSRPPMVRDNRHDSAHLFGAICPLRGVGAAIIMPSVNTEAMNEHLKEISTQVAPGAHAVLVLDGAGWHQTGGELNVPGNISLLFLPPYAPELNPMENVWEYLRANKLCALVWETYDAIINACRDAWTFLISDPDRIRSIGIRDWACVNV